MTRWISRGRGIALAVGLRVGLAAQPAAPPPPPAPVPLAAYAQFGTTLAQSAHLGELGWTEAQFNAFVEGMRSSFHGQPIPMDAAGQRLAEQTGRQLQDLAAPRPPAPAAGAAPPAPVAAPDPQAVATYFHRVGKTLGLQWTDNGLGYNVGPGTSGVRPRAGDTVILSCQAFAADTTTALPQLSSDHVRVRMADLLPGLSQGLQMMPVGSHGLFILPAALSFGAGSWPAGVARGSPILFRLALLEVVPGPAAP